MEKQVAFFTHLEIDNIFNVYLQNDSTNTIMAEGPGNLMDKLELNVYNDTLFLNLGLNLSFLYPSERINIYIPHDNLRGITVEEASSIFSLDTIRGNVSVIIKGPIAFTDMKVNCNNFQFYTHYQTYGVYNFSGKANNSYLSCYKGSSIHAENLVSANAVVRNFSVGDIYVNVTEKLTAGIYNYGNIYYYGDPEIEIREITSRGQIIKID